MIKANSRIIIDTQKIAELSKAQITALKQTAEALHTEVVQAQVFPFQTGNLQNESTYVDCSKADRGEVTIVSNTPYARRLYYHPEYDFSSIENPWAKGRWYEDWLLGGEKGTRAAELYKELYRRNAKL